MQINDFEPNAPLSSSQQIRSSKPVRTIVDLFERHPYIEFSLIKLFKTSQAIAVGSCAWKATQIFDDPFRDPDEPLNNEFITTTFFATALLCGAFAVTIFRHGCPPRFRKPLPLFISVIPALFAACMGVMLASKQQLHSATVIWNNISASNIQTEYVNDENLHLFRLGIKACMNDLYSNRELYTLPECFSCEYQSQFTEVSWQTLYGVVEQQRVVPINQSICPQSLTGAARKWWSSFKSIDFNLTSGPWPCNPDYAGGTNPTVIAATLILGDTVGLRAPFSITVTPIENSTAGCAHVEGTAFSVAAVTIICGSDSEKFKKIPQTYFTCFTPAALAFAENYTSNFQPYIPLPNQTFPKLVAELIDGNWANYQFIVAGYFAGTSLLFLSLSNLRCRCGFAEEQPLLPPNQQQA